MQKEITIVEIKRRLEKMFTPDVSVEWDDKWKMYKIRALNINGDAYLRRANGFKAHNKDSNGKVCWHKMIVKSELDNYLNHMGFCGLCVEIIDDEENKNNTRI